MQPPRYNDGVDELRKRLDELKVRASAPQPAAPQPAANGVGVSSAPLAVAQLADLIGGRERICGSTVCWHIETPFAQACERHGFALPPHVFNWQAQLLPMPAAGLDPARTVAIDIETGGFSGTEVFLVGLVPLDSRPLHVVQFLARDYAEEEAVLHAIAELGQQRDTWVTFNGKTFDEPFLRDRAVRYRVTLKPPANHVDVLQAARRRLRGQVPNCRLQTLEQHLLGWQRIGDVPGSDIPSLFHHFIRTGNAAVIRPVIEHNQLDLISCTELLLRLG